MQDIAAVRHAGHEELMEVVERVAHRHVLADRKARAQRGEAKFLTLDQLRARLRGSES